MSLTSAAPTTRATDRPTRPWARLACAAAAVVAVPVFALASLTGDSGVQITAGLADDVVPLTVASILAVLVSAGLFLAAVRLGRSTGGDCGRVIAAAGAAVALMYAGYYAVFGAGAVVASQMLSDPGPGLGEAASLLLNIMEITRYAPGLALVAAAVVAGQRLPRVVRIPAGILAVLTLVPLTSWVAALLIPVWLGVSAALTPDTRSATARD
jgi:hypothetical protein